jgi:hypothetical protein
MTLQQRYRLCHILIGIIATTFSAGCTSQQGRVREIDPQADLVFKQMCDTLDGAKAIRFRAHATMDRVVDTGQLAQFQRTSEIAVARPDRLCAMTDSDDGRWLAVYRGKTLTLLDRDANLYATESVPGRLDKMLDYMVDNYDLVMPMADLLLGKTYDALLADVETGTYLGLHSVGDTKCHHLLFLQENIDWQLWIDAGNRPLPRKMVITYRQELDEPQYVATMNHWDLAPVLSEDTFTFTPPAGAKSVAMYDLIVEE